MRLCVCLVFFFVLSCGYKAGTGGIGELYTSIRIPYIEGDQKGSLTKEVILQLAKSADLICDQDCGELTLQAEVVGVSTEGIGYRFDRNDDGSVSERLVKAEGRLFAECEITVFETATGKAVLGPVLLSAHSDYDHDYYLDETQATAFSLGQLGDVDLAEDMAVHALDRALAGRIVDYISRAW